MELNVKSYGSFCALERFTINGADAVEDDFGIHSDQGPDDDHDEIDYGCANMQFEAKPSTPEVLAKYGITEAQYAEVCEKLSSCLSFGNCGWCV